MQKQLKDQIKDLISDYEKARNVFNGAGMNAELKNEALQGMANALQLQQVALQNLAQYLHVLREYKSEVNK